MAGPSPSDSFDRAVAAHNAGRLLEAEELYRRLLAEQPGHAHALNNLAILCKQSGRLEEALEFYGRSLAAEPGFAAGHYNMAMLYERLGRFDEAATAYGEAIRLQPGNADAMTNLGALLISRGHSERAVEVLEQAVALAPDRHTIRLNLATALKRQKRVGDALEHLRHAVRLAPDALVPLMGFIDAALAACDFDGVDEGRRRLDEAVESGALGRSEDWSVLTNIRYSTLFEGASPAAAQAAAAEMARRLGPVRPRPPFQDGERLNIGYVSAHFGNHAIGHVTRRLYAAHDRSRFKIHAYATTDRAAEDEPYHQDIRQGVEVFRDASDLSPEQLAELVTADGIHILVDLDGHMVPANIRLMALRPAPVQVFWLGHAGSPGLPFHDYVIADPVVVPHGEENSYREAVVRLPVCYHPTDRHELSEDCPTRAEEGLPAKAMVLCAFNNAQKIDRRVWQRWMTILAAVPKAVLWLSHPTSAEAMADNLRREAKALGIDPARLVFAKMEPDKARHIRRQQLADLFVDTLTLTASTTALDALWAGLPLVTCPGETWPSRIAASFLTALGLEGCIQPDLDAYEARIIELCQDGKKRAALRRRLSVARLARPLFDIAFFTRDLERAYLGMAEQARRGQAPTGFDLPYQAATLPAETPAMPPPPAPARRSCFCGAELVPSLNPAYLRCCACGTFHVDKMPSAEELRRFYGVDSYWRDYVSGIGHPTIDTRGAYLQRDGRVAHWWSLVTRHVPAPKKLFEVGFAEGTFLAHCQAMGVPELAGQEVDEGTCALVRGKTGIQRLYAGLFPSGHEETGDWDAVVGFDVLEHAPEPVVFLEGAARMLAPHGVAIFQTPCWRGDGPFWGQMKPEEHMVLLNEFSARLLVDRSPLELVEIAPAPMAHDMFLICRRRDHGR